MLLIGVVILVFVGPDRIPEMMSTAGKWYGKFRRMSDDLRRAFNTEVARVEADKRRDELDSRRREADVRRQAEREERERAAAAGESAPVATPAAEPAPTSVPPAVWPVAEPTIEPAAESAVEPPGRSPEALAGGPTGTAAAEAQRPSRPLPEGTAARAPFPTPPNTEPSGE